MTIRQRPISSLVLLAALMAALAASARAAEPKSSAQNQLASVPQEKELLATLRSAPPAERAMACKQLAIYGSQAAVPDLARLLADAELASWARIALEAIPGPAADEALRQAMSSLQGNLLVGTINSIGVRRDAQAVDSLAGRLKDQDAAVASAAAVALGHIGNPTAAQALRSFLAAAPVEVRSAVAEGCVLCAEGMLTDKRASEAAQLYDEIRRAELPKQRIVEATRGAILARGTGGIELLLEQLRSPDKVFFQLGLGTARELSGHEVAGALAAELPGAAPERAALLLGALADRNDKSALPAVLEAVNSGPQQVRLAAIGALQRLGDVSCASPLLQIATGSDAELAEAAKTALAELPGEKVDADIAARLPGAEGKSLAVLIEVVGQRRIDATATLLKSVDSSDAEVRSAALSALGATIGAKQLPMLISYVVAPKYPADEEPAQRALRAAATRMPDREDCAHALAAAMPKAPAATQAALVEILAAVAGTTALDTIGAAAKSPTPELQDTASRVLGEWMNVEAGPVLLDLVTSAPDAKYQTRALRGYIRLVRQFPMSDRERAKMCQKALAASSNVAEKKLILEVLGRYPTRDTLKLAAAASGTPAIKRDAVRVALAIALKLGDQGGEVREIVAKLPLDPVKLEIVKAEYGAGSVQKDVTEALRRHARNVQLISLPSPAFSEHLGGDPLPGTPKQLTIQYRINGKAGTATFPENSLIWLAMPK